MALPPTDRAYNPSDPLATYVSASCLDFLLIELVPLAQRMATEIAEREEEWTRGSLTASSSQSQRQGGGGESIRGSGADGGSSGGVRAGGLDEEELREAMFYRLEMLGYRVGLGVVERFSRDKPRFNDTLDVIKFLCKDLWTLVFRKQIDNLKTNHRGTYVLTDNTFAPLRRMSVEKGVDGTLARAQPFLFFPAGVIRGALASLGVNATVQAETSALPGATFQIRTVGAKP
ncbi:hypothetical protein W97_05891 [Coniosporium apollinis CBS 100218]|uniref:Trafficking protein particle complex subunit 6B n=1 Tax=Coniosporium apollinis (strain CBS 100218) TaxID=1168221 RepID=R7YXJ3_CONA1|nr:uncharacterized protein W97_05891 [Coniosporium apollinis CBS 100218]EON66645.1 hypothetical protein W97_05891 [Coniosporium apollinis CBS 100218]